MELHKQYSTSQLGLESNVGFKDYDTLIFNKNSENDTISPFTQELWNKTMKWYSVFAIISGRLILIAVFILSYKIISAGMNTARKNEAKESLMRLLFRWYIYSLCTTIYTIFTFYK